MLEQEQPLWNHISPILLEEIDVTQFVGGLLPVIPSNGSETEESQDSLYWVDGSSFEYTLKGDSTISITDGYDEMEVDAKEGASIQLNIKDSTTKIENADASAQDYSIIHTRTTEDGTEKSVIIKGEISTTVNTEKTDESGIR